MSPEYLKKLSKFCAVVLRHKPEAFGLKMEAEGWIVVDDLLAAAQKSKFPDLTKSMLTEMVLENDKKRYSFNDDQTKIRANQGHSISIDLGLKPVEPPKILYHGTARHKCQAILKKGLLKMGRQHVHLSDNRRTAESVGSRHGVPVVFEVLSRSMYHAGLKFYLSENNVWLTDNVPVTYLKVSN